MAARNGSKVDVREFYKEVAELRKEAVAIATAHIADRQQMEVRLVAVIRDGNRELEERILEQVGENRKDIDCLQGDVVSLKVADRRWAGLVGLVAAAVAGVTAFFVKR